MKRLLLIALIALPALAQRVTSAGMTVADMDRSIAFYRDVLSFENVSDEEQAGDDVPNDVAYWQTTVASAKVDRPLIIRDPDGHALRLVPQ